MAATTAHAPDLRFGAMLERHGRGALTRDAVATIQINVGKVCNQACHHCHVDAGPRRTESMGQSTARRVLELLEASPQVNTLDITGGAPELNPNFAMIAEGARALGRDVIVRCNLTVILEPNMDWLVDFYRRSRVQLVCSLPCYTAGNVDRQRGHGVFDKSIAALLLLNAAGFGRGELTLDLAYNPIGASLPPPQAELEAQYRDELARNFGIVFDRLLMITNMPISRFAHQLHSAGGYSEYMSLLVNHFNPATVDGLMCRSLVSIGYDGRLYDCDFNQMLEIPLAHNAGPSTIWDLARVDEIERLKVATGSHCFGCTAGAGSSCGGTIA